MQNAAKVLCAVSLLALVAPISAMAQDLSDEELLNLFLMQRDAYRAAASGEDSATRGLTLVTLDNVDVVSEAASLGSPGTVDDNGTSAPGTESGIEIAKAPEAPGTPEGEEMAQGDQAPEAPPVETAPDQGTQVANVEPDGEKTPIVVGNFVGDMQVNVRIEFDLDSAALRPEQLPKLDQLCRVMNAADIQHFRIIGHTDASGSDDYNQNLSQLRAQEVQRYFVHQCGVDAGRLEAVGVGEKLIPDGTDPKAPENRRVEFQALA